MSGTWRHVNAVQNIDKDAAKLTVHQSAVLMAPALHARPDGTAWPSQARIERETNVCLRSVVAALENLEQRGLLASSIRYRPGTNVRTTNLYTLNLEAICALPSIGAPDAHE